MHVLSGLTPPCPTRRYSNLTCCSTHPPRRAEVAVPPCVRQGSFGKVAPNLAGVAAKRVGRGLPGPFLRPIEQDRMRYQQPAPDTENAASEPKRGARGRQRGEGRQRDVTKLMTAAREKYETGRLKGAIGLFKRALNGDRGNAAAKIGRAHV